MKHVLALLLAITALLSTPVRAAVIYDGYATGPGGFSTPYPAVNPQVFAGMVELAGGSGPLLAMSDDYNTRVNVGDFWPATAYTYAEIQAGAPVKFTPAQYARAGYIMHDYFPMDLFPNSMVQTFATLNGNNTLATLNTQMWDIMSSTSCPISIFFNGCSGIDTYDWSGSMLVLGGRDEYLAPINVAQLDPAIFGQPGQIVIDPRLVTTPSVPIPPTLWLMGSGLVGLVTVARRKK